MSMKKYEEWNANHKHDNPPREKIVKLGRFEAEEGSEKAPKVEF